MTEAQAEKGYEIKVGKFLFPHQVKQTTGNPEGFVEVMLMQNIGNGLVVT